MVPVPLSLKVLAFGLAAPFGSPKVADGAFMIWDPDGASIAPDKFETPGLEVVFKPKVLAVGQVADGCFDLMLLLLWWNVSLLWDKVENRFFELHFIGYN